MNKLQLWAIATSCVLAISACKKDTSKPSPVTTTTVTVSTFAGSGAVGSDNGTGTAATFNVPKGVAVDASGNVYVTDTDNNLIRKITSAGVVTTLAGSGTAGSTDGTGTAASFNRPFGITVDGSGNVYVTDLFNNKIRKITSAGVVTTLAGSGSSGSTDATGASASFNQPTDVAIDASGNVYVADMGNHKIRKISPSGVVTTFAGSGVAGSYDATGTEATFNYPRGIALDASGNFYVADRGSYKIRKITPAGVVSTLAGSGTSGTADGTGSAASFKAPNSVSVDGSGNVYVTDYINNKIRKVTSAGVVSTIAGSGYLGSTDGNGTEASFYNPDGIAVGPNGNVFIADTDNNKIRKMVITTTTARQSFINQ